MTSLAVNHKSYADYPKSSAYQAYFPDYMRCTPESTPVEEWWSWRGLDVHLDRMSTPGSPIKIIVLHGAGAYGRVMAPAAVLARKFGYDTVAPDLPGYGLTQVPRGRMKYPLWVDCVSDLIDAEIARDGKPVVLFGVSLGGLLAYQAAAQSKKAIGVVATTMADTREPGARASFARNPFLGKFGLGALSILPIMSDWFPMPMALVTKVDRISNNPELSKLCAGDRMGGGNWVPARFLRTFMNHPPAIEPEQFKVCPILIAHPGEDRMTDIAHTKHFYERLACPKKFVTLDGASHMPVEHPGVDQLEASAREFLAELTKQIAR